MKKYTRQLQLLQVAQMSKYWFAVQKFKKKHENSREHIKRIYIFFSFFKQTLQQIKYRNIKSIKYRHNIRDNLYCLSALVDFSWSILLLMDQNRNRWLRQSIIRGNYPIKYSIPMHKIQRVDTVNISTCFALHSHRQPWHF